MSYRRAKSLDKNLVWAEYFNSEQEVRRNGATLTNATVSNGKLVCNTDLAVIEYSGIVGAGSDTGFTLRLKFAEAITLSGATEYLFHAPASTDNWVQAFVNATYIYAYVRHGPGNQYYGIRAAISLIDGAKELVFIFPTLANYLQTKLYVDGEVVSTTAYDTNGQTGEYRLKDIKFGLAGDTWQQADIDSIEIYNKVLTAEEVSNLYNDSRYSMPVLGHKEQLGTNLVSNGTFDSGTSGWGVSDPDELIISAVNGRLRVYSNDAAWRGASTSFTTVVGQRYRVKASSYTGTINTYQFWVGTAFNGNQLYNSGSLGVDRDFDVIVTATTTTTWINLINNASNTGKYMEWDDISFEVIEVEETSKILHVNAFQGVARNLLSGDHVGDELVTDQYFSSASNWTLDRWTISNNTATCTSGASSTMVLNNEPDVLVVGKTYKVIIKIEEINATLIRVYIDSNTGFKDVTSVGTHVLYIVCTNIAELFAIRAVTPTGNNVISWFSIHEAIPEVTNTDIEVVKDGQIRVPRFNGSTSKIDCGSYNDLTGDISIFGWVNQKATSGGLGDDIFNNGELNFGFARSANIGKLYLSSSQTSYDRSNVGISFGEWYFVGARRKADGKVTFFIDGEVSGTEDQTGDTPAAGTTNLIVGNDSSGDRPVEGKIADLKIYSGLMTDEEFSQAYTATKHLYGK